MMLDPHRDMVMLQSSSNNTGRTAVNRSPLLWLLCCCCVQRTYTHHRTSQQLQARCVRHADAACSAPMHTPGPISSLCEACKFITR